MDQHKQAFLKSYNICDPDIVDCDPIKQTVTFRNGDTRQLVDVYSRVMGYHSRVAAFNPGKQQEHRDRTLFREATTHE